MSSMRSSLKPGRVQQHEAMNAQDLLLLYLFVIILFVFLFYVIKSVTENITTQIINQNSKSSLRIMEAH